MDRTRQAASDDVLTARAIALAERGRGTVSPNPLVGCLLAHGGRVVGRGWHERPGGPHAEVVALEDAGPSASGATAYVTLEPCRHHGRTPACTDALADSGVARVVYAVDDPNPAAAGGAARLRAAGIDTAAAAPQLAAWVRAQNRTFLHAVTTGRAHVTLKLAQTRRGSLRPDDGGRWVTGRVARRQVHRLRRRADAVLVGSGTVLADDPRLDVRSVDSTPGAPRPVVLDRRARTPHEAAVVRRGAVLVTGPDAPVDWRREHERRGVTVVAAPAGPDGGVDLHEALVALHALELDAVLAEPGPRLARALVLAGLVDRLHLHVAGVSRAADVEPTPAVAGVRWRTLAERRLGGDLELVAEPEAG